MPEAQREVPQCYPVWRHAHRRDPHMAAIRAILRDNAHDLDHAARLIATVLHMARSEAALKRDLPETAPAQ